MVNELFPATNRDTRTHHRVRDTLHKRKQARNEPRLLRNDVDGNDQARSKRSRFITLVQAATKSLTNFSFASEAA